MRTATKRQPSQAALTAAIFDLLDALARMAQRGRLSPNVLDAEARLRHLTGRTAVRRLPGDE